MKLGCTKYIARCLHLGLRCLVSICRPPGHWEGHASKGGRFCSNACFNERHWDGNICCNWGHGKIATCQECTGLSRNSVKLNRKEWCLRRSNFHISHHFSWSNDEMGWQHLCIEVIPSHVRKLFDSFGFCICTEACDVQLHYCLMFTSIFTWTQLFSHERVSAKMELQQSTRSNAWPHVWFLHGRIGVRRHSAEPVRFTLVFT